MAIISSKSYPMLTLFIRFKWLFRMFFYANVPGNDVKKESREIIPDAFLLYIEIESPKYLNFNTVTNMLANK